MFFDAGLIEPARSAFAIVPSVISADSTQPAGQFTSLAGPPPPGYRPYLDPQYRKAYDQSLPQMLQIIEERQKDFRFFIDGEIYANLLATGWSKETVQAYQYKFIPTSVGCQIIIRHIASTQTFDLTENIEW